MRPLPDQLARVGLRPVVRSLTSLLLAIAILFVGSGLLGVLIPTRAQIEGFPTVGVALLGTAHYLGFVAGCVLVPGLIRRVGHIRTFAALAALGASAALTHALVVALPVWIVLRTLLGFCFAGLFMVVESWLNGSADRTVRGRLLSIYMVVNLAGVAAGKLLLATADPAGFTLFAIACLCICLSLVPVALTRSAVPSLPAATSLAIVRLYGIAPVGVVGCLAVGATNGAFWTLAPVFAETRFESTAGVAGFMAIAVLGALIGQWPLGQLSDRIDRRQVIALACLGAAGLAASLATLAGEGPALHALSLAFGAMALPVYSLCIAHTNDFARNEEFVEVSSDLLLLFGIGAMLGPLAAAALMSQFGSPGLFLFTAPIHLGLAAFALYRMTRRSRAPAEERTVFMEVPGTSQAVLQLDPRAEAGEPASST